MQGDRVWRIATVDSLAVQCLARELALPLPLARVLAARGWREPADALAFLSDDSLPGPAGLPDLEPALARITAAVDRGERITVYGDYDADGVTSTALMCRVLRRLGANVDYYIPSRLEEGYGLNAGAMQEIAARGTRLVITVDCGISAVAEVAEATRLGLEVIITDHHTPQPELPAALALINPKLPSSHYPLAELAGVGVAYKVAQGLIGDTAADYLDLVAVGTVADVVPLMGENRTLVRAGLKLLAASGNVGLQALCAAAGVELADISAERVAFGLAPRLNAAGRLGDSRTGVELLLTDDPAVARQLAGDLDRGNRERQKIEQTILDQAVELAERSVDRERDRIVVLAGDGWHHGIIGIVASKISERYGLPAILLCRDGDVARGSARSTPELNMFEALTGCRDLLDHYGGHALAAGLTLPAARVDELRRRLNQLAWQAYGETMPQQVLNIDAEATPEELTLDLVTALRQLEPFGEGNGQPLFVCRGLSVVEARSVGSRNDHLKLRLRARDRRKEDLDGIGFGLGGLAAKCEPGAVFDIALVPERNLWNGRERLQLRIVDMLPAGSQRAGAIISLQGDGLKAALDETAAVGEARAAAARGAGSGADRPASAEASALVEELFAQASELLYDDVYRHIAARQQFFTKVAGVTFAGRQAAVADCSEGERLIMRRQPDNPVDANAIALLRSDGRQVGFLNARLARNLAPLIDAGAAYDVTVSQRTGGDSGRSFGLNILIERREELAAGGDPGLLAGRLRDELARLQPAERNERIRRQLLGDHTYRDKQLEAVAALEAGASPLVIMGTGRGKSVIFQTVAARRALTPGAVRRVTIVVYPLRALVNDQYEKMRQRLGALGLRVLKANGSLAAGEKERALAAIMSGDVDVILTTPEYIEYHADKFRRLAEAIALFVVDECHHVAMSTLSHRPSYRRLDCILDQLGWPQRLAVTATAGDSVAADITALLRLDRLLIDPHVRANLELIDRRNRPDRDATLADIVRTGDKTIIYVNSRAQATRLAEDLRRRIPELRNEILFYHAGMTDTQRQAVERYFAGGLLRCVVSTSAFGEGVDITDIRNVVHYHLTFNQTEFNQESGG
ncbi:MAG: single-stranded-DNA-specific exonuclease RecJ, partial [Chloroflexota bacterium]